MTDHARFSAGSVDEPQALFSRRFSSRSTASRIKAARDSLSSKTRSIRSSVPPTRRAGICSSLIFGLPTGFSPLARGFCSPLSACWCARLAASTASAGVTSNHSPLTRLSRRVQCAQRSAAKAVRRGIRMAIATSNFPKCETCMMTSRSAGSFATPIFCGPSAAPITYKNASSDMPYLISHTRDERQETQNKRYHLFTRLRYLISSITSERRQQMTRTDALTFAKSLYAAYQAADIEHLFRGAPEPVKADYCYRHGWIIFGGHAFNDEDLTGIPYDINQGGWAWV